MSNAYDAMMPPSALDKAVDQAVDQANQAFLNDPESLRLVDEAAERWLAWDAAEKAAGPHAVVLPIALANDLMALIEGEATTLPADLLPDMLQDHIIKAAQRG